MRPVFNSDHTVVTNGNDLAAKIMWNHSTVSEKEKLCEITLLLFLLQKKWDGKFCQMTGLFVFSSISKPKIMWNHITVVSTSKQVGKKNFVKSQPICVLMLEQFGLTEKILSNHSTLSANFKRNKISPKTKNYVKPM